MGQCVHNLFHVCIWTHVPLAHYHRNLDMGRPLGELDLAKAVRHTLWSSHLFLFSCPLRRRARIFALKNSYSPFCSQPSLEHEGEKEKNRERSFDGSSLAWIQGSCAELPLHLPSKPSADVQILGRGSAIQLAEEPWAWCVFQSLVILLPVSRSIMGRWAVEGFNCSQQPLAGGHWRRQADVFRVQRLVLMIFQLKAVAPKLQLYLRQKMGFVKVEAGDKGSFATAKDPGPPVAASGVLRHPMSQASHLAQFPIVPHLSHPPAATQRRIIRAAIEEAMGKQSCLVERHQQLENNASSCTSAQSNKATQESSLHCLHPANNHLL